MNKIIIHGRLVRDPEMKTGASGVEFCKFTVAVDRKLSKEKMKDRQADFFDCTAFGKTAEHLEKYWHKGMKMALVGRLEQSVWKDKDGKNRSSVGITVEEVEFCEKKGESAPEPKAQDFAPVQEDEGLPFVF